MPEATTDDASLDARCPARSAPALRKGDLLCGCIVSATTSNRSRSTVARSTCSRSRAPKHLERALRVVAAPVEAPVHEPLHASSHRQEQRRHDQGRSGDRQVEPPATERYSAWPTSTSPT